MAKILVNSFSLNMLADPTRYFGINIPISKSDVSADCESAIGHIDTAAVVSSDLGFEVKPNRTSISVGPDDELFVAQYIGPRLEEGAKELPEGSKLLYFKIYIRELHEADKVSCPYYCGCCPGNCMHIMN